MALTFFWRCEGATLSGTDDYSAGDTVAAVYSNGDINLDNAKVGTNSVDSVNNDGGYTFSLSSDIFNGDLGCVGSWMYIEANWQGGRTLVARDASATDSRIGIRPLGTTGSGNFEFFVGVNAVGESQAATTGLTLENGIWYFVVGRWDKTNTKCKVEVYDSSVSSLGSNENTSTNSSHYPTTADLDEWRITSEFAQTQQWDNIMVGSTYDDPLQDYALYTSYTQVGGTTIEVPVGPWR